MGTLSTLEVLALEAFLPAEVRGAPPPSIAAEGLFVTIPSTATPEEVLASFAEIVVCVQEQTGIATGSEAERLIDEIEVRLDLLAYGPGDVETRLQQFTNEDGSTGPARIERLRSLTDPLATPDRLHTQAATRALLLRMKRYRLWAGRVDAVHRRSNALEDFRQAVAAATGSGAVSDALAFDHERLLALIASADVEAAKGPGKHLVRGVVEVELWTSGFPADPDKEVGLDRAVRSARIAYGLSEGNTIDSALVIRLLDDNQSDTPPIDPSKAAALLSDNVEQVMTFWGTVKTVFRTVWDGVGRALRWLGNRVHEVLGGLADWTKTNAAAAAVGVMNAFRVVRAFGARVLGGMKQTASRLGDALNDLATGVHEPQGQPTLAIRFAGPDFDGRVVVATGAKAEDIARALARVQRMPIVIRLAGRVVAIVITALVGAATVVALVKAVVEIVREWPAISVAMSELDATPS